MSSFPKNNFSDAAIIGWVNECLKGQVRSVKSIKDLADSVLLIKLLECVCGTCLPRYFSNPTSRFHHIENFNRVFDLAAKNDVKVVCCSPEDLADGNEKLTRGFIWSLFHRFADRNTDVWRKTFVNDQEVKYDDLMKKFIHEESRSAFKTPPRVHPRTLSKDAAAIRIQTRVRGWIARQNYKELVRLNKHRNRVVEEIIETEKVYVNRLLAIINGYLAPISKAPQHFLDNDISSIIEIYKLNQLLLQDLTERYGNWSPCQKIGDVFGKMAPFLKLYTFYCHSYGKILQKIQEAKKDPQFPPLLQECFERPESLGIELDALLIAPVQRIPRYILLLQDLISHTWPDHPDYNHLCLALKDVQKTADQVNESIHQAERMNKVLSIQNRLNGTNEYLVQPGRHFIREGLLNVHHVDRTDAAKTYFFLFNDALVWAEKSTFSSGLQFRGLIALNDGTTTLKELPDNNVFQNAFQVCTPNKTLTVKCKSSEEKTVWMDSINQILQSGNRIRGTDVRTETPFQVSIRGTETRRDSKKEFTIYVIEITHRETGKNWTIFKRYREFDMLHKQIRRKFPTHAVTNPPPKHMIGSLSKETVEMRRIMLEVYLQGLLSKREICDCSSMKSFLEFEIETQPEPAFRYSSAILSPELYSKESRRKAFTSSEQTMPLPDWRQQIAHLHSQPNRKQSLSQLNRSPSSQNMNPLGTISSSVLAQPSPSISTPAMLQQKSNSIAFPFRRSASKVYGVSNPPPTMDSLPASPIPESNLTAPAQNTELLGELREKLVKNLQNQ